MLIDITQTVEPGMGRYDSIADFQYEWLRHYDAGGGMALSRFTMTSHLGTHIDAPYHFMESGSRAADIPLETLCGAAQVVDARGRAYIDGAFLRTIPLRAPRVLFRTDNTEALAAGGAFENVHLTSDACDFLVERGTLLVGIDYFSVDRRGDKSRAAHLPLLRGGVVILEAVELAGVQPGEYTLWCLPLKLRDLEGAPCRAMLQKGGTI